MQLAQFYNARMNDAGANVSGGRILGFACDRLWVLIMFYSIAPFLSEQIARENLYTHLLISLGVMAIALLAMALIARRQSRVNNNTPLLVGSGAFMVVGSILCFIGDASSNSGILLLGAAGFLTGAGSATLFIAWLELLADQGEMVLIIEYALSYLLAFLCGLILLYCPVFVIIAVAVITPLISVYLLRKLLSEQGERKKMQPFMSISRRTYALFAKALLGVALIGLLQGFVDSYTGFRAFAVDNFYGTNLYLWGFAATLLATLFGVFKRDDAIFFIYRFAILLLCAGSLLTIYAGDYNTFSGGVVFGGYVIFVIVLAVVCANIFSSFGVGITRSIATGFATLYLGEMAGQFLCSLPSKDFLSAQIVPISVVAVAVVLIAHLFLFTEVDLIRIGIGELDMVVPEEADIEPGEERDAALDATTKLIVERYGLSPREADVLPLLLQGRTIARIQETLFISQGTVSTHIRHIYQKTGAENRQALLDLSEQISHGESPDEQA